MRGAYIIFTSLIFVPKFILQIYLFKSDTEKLKNLGKELKNYFEKLGGIYIKFGQILSLRIDVLPLEVCNELRSLLDKVDTFPIEYTKEIFKKDFNKSIDEIFSVFPSEPIASASIGQVYKAKLQNGENVAVKVIRPNIEESAKKDLRLITRIAKLLNILTFNIFRINKVAEEFEMWILEEIDYTNEERNLLEFNNQPEALLPIFDIPLKINVPKVYSEYSSKNILTMEFIEGITINKLIELRNSSDQTEFNKLVEDGLDVKLIVNKMIKYLIKQLFIDGFFNGDPHPANIVVTKNNEIYYLDFGLVGRLDKKQRLCVFRFLRSMTVFDYKTASSAGIIMFNIFDPRKQEAFRLTIKEIVLKLKKVSEAENNQYLQFSQKSAVEILKAIYKLRLPIPVDISLSLRAAVTSDGLMQSLYPEGEFKEMTIETYKASIALTYENIKENLTPDKLKKWILKIVNFIEAETIDD